MTLLHTSGVIGGVTAMGAALANVVTSVSITATIVLACTAVVGATVSIASFLLARKRDPHTALTEHAAEDTRRFDRIEDTLNIILERLPR